MSMLQLGVTKRMSRGNWKEPMGSYQHWSMDHQFSLSQVSSNVFTPVRRESKRSVRTPPAVMSFFQLQIQSCLKKKRNGKNVENEGDKKKKKRKDGVECFRNAFTDRWIFSPIVVYVCTMCCICRSCVICLLLLPLLFLDLGEL